MLLYDMAGKGPQLRKGANLNAYWDNYDNIFKPKKEVLSDKDEEKYLDDKNSMSHSEFLKISKRYES